MQKYKFKSLEELPTGFNPDILADILGISRSNAYSLVKSEGFPKINIGKRIVIPKEAFIKWLDENTVRS